QNGVQGSYPQQNNGWAQETALDLDMASAMCPTCRIILVEANSATFGNLAAAENTAAALAHVVSNSYGGGETGSQPYESAYNHPGVAITVSSGDSGYGVQFPASSPHVTAVGGTSVAAPLVAGLYGANGGAVNYGSDPYGHVSSLFDVTSGSNGSCGGFYPCTGGPGYDGPTGLGTPNTATPF